MTNENTDTGSDTNTDENPGDSTGGNDAKPTARSVDPAAPDEFGLVQIWWGDGKGKTTAAMGMGFRAAGHGYRVHMLQFMKGGAGSVEDVRGEYNAIENFPGFTYENTGHYGWHGFLDGTDDDEHAAQASGGLARTRELLGAADDADLSDPRPLDAPPEDGVHLLILDEILYAVNRGLLDTEDVVGLVESKPDDLELVLTGGHERPDFACELADLVTRVEKEKHPIDSGHSARKGTEY